MATLPPGEVLSLESLIAPTPHGIASRVLARTPALPLAPTPRTYALTFAL
jgi:hypothetical protein